MSQAQKKLDFEKEFVMSQAQKKLDFETIKKSLHSTWDKVTSHPKALLAAVVLMIVAVYLIFVLLQSKSTANRCK